MIAKIGFAMTLIGVGGMAEAYGFNKSLAMSLTLVIVGGLMIFAGDMSNDIKNYKRSNRCNDNVLDRLFFLGK